MNVPLSDSHAQMAILVNFVAVMDVLVIIVLPSSSLLVRRSKKKGWVGSYEA